MLLCVHARFESSRLAMLVVYALRKKQCSYGRLSVLQLCIGREKKEASIDGKYLTEYNDGNLGSRLAGLGRSS